MIFIVMQLELYKGLPKKRDVLKLLLIRAKTFSHMTAFRCSAFCTLSNWQRRL